MTVYLFLINECCTCKSIIGKINRMVEKDHGLVHHSPFLKVKHEHVFSIDYVNECIIFSMKLRHINMVTYVY